MFRFPLPRFGLRPAALCMMLLALGLAGIAPRPAAAGPALVFDARSGEVLHAHEPFARWYPASLTKMMTAYVSFLAVREGRVRLDTPVRMSQYAASQPPSKMGYPVGTEISLEYALRIIMVKSANDISVAIGEAVGGSLPAFVTMMNRAAARLGMTDTSFVNPHGLPDERQITTARDLALLVRALIREFPQYQYFFETQALQVGDAVLTNHNKLLGRFRGADGMKTGFICASGFNIAASATRNGRRIVAIVLGGQSGRHRNEVAAGLLEAGFKTQGGFSLFSRGRPTIADLRRPAVVPSPPDLRPYACQKQTMPAHLASFGTTATGSGTATASNEVTRPGPAMALAAAPVIGLSSASAASAPVIASERVFTGPVPLPRPRPARSAGGEAASVASIVEEATTAGAPVPLPNPMRVPVR